MLVAEGSIFVVDHTVSTAGLLDNVSAVAQWGDGTQSSLTVASAPAAGPIRARFDYSLDTTGFFNASERRAILQAAADIVFSKFSDILTAITPSQSNTWQTILHNPTTGVEKIIDGGAIASNELLIYVGARNLPGNSVASAGPGGFGWRGTPAWGNIVTGRGQPGALGTTLTDVATWGGTMTVDPATKWHFGLTTEGLDADEYDFLSVVSHEFMHILGFGIVRPDVISSWSRLISNGFFTGANSRASNGGQNVRLSPEQGHWVEGTQSNGQEALMDPTINNTGIRKLVTPLDIAGLQDIGWQPISQQSRLTGSKIYGDDGSYPVAITVRGGTAGSQVINLGNTLVTNVAPTITNTRTATIARVNVPLAITDIGTFSDPGFGSSENFLFEIDWGDNLPGTASRNSGVATIDRAGRVGVLTTGSFNGSHTYLSAGNYNVTYRVIDDNFGVSQKTFSVEVLSAPEIRLSLGASSINEDSGANATSLIVDLVGFDNSSPVTVNLSSSDTSEASVAASVTFAAGITRVTTPINAVDDALLDGTQVINLLASSGSVVATSARLEVIDIETIGLSLSTSSVREDASAGAAVLRVSRSNTDRQAPLSVALTSTIAGVTFPATVSIAAGLAFVDVGVTVADDSIINGDRLTTIRGVATNYVRSEVQLTINDFEPIQWVLGSITLNEGIGVVSRSINLSIPAAAPTSGVVINLSNSVSNRLQIPATVTIPAGQTQVSVPVSVINNTFSENDQIVIVRATGTGYFPSSLTIRVLDDDRSAWTNPDNIFDVDNDTLVFPLDALILINYLNSIGISQLPPTKGIGELNWLDVSGNGWVEPLDVLLIINLLNERARTGV